MIESMISIARTTTRNVKRWRDEGDMRRRWCTPGWPKPKANSGESAATSRCPNSSPRSAVTPTLSPRPAILNPTNSLHEHQDHPPQQLQQSTGHPRHASPARGRGGVDSVVVALSVLRIQDPNGSRHPPPQDPGPARERTTHDVGLGPDGGSTAPTASNVISRTTASSRAVSPGVWLASSWPTPRSCRFALWCAATAFTGI